jgi:hypothetical protein
VESCGPSIARSSARQGSKRRASTTRAVHHDIIPQESPAAVAAAIATVISPSGPAKDSTGGAHRSGVRRASTLLFGRVVRWEGHQEPFADYASRATFVGVPCYGPAGALSPALWSVRRRAGAVFAGRAHAIRRRASLGAWTQSRRWERGVPGSFAGRCPLARSQAGAAALGLVVTSPPSTAPSWRRRWGADAGGASAIRAPAGAPPRRRTARRGAGL